MGEPRFDVVHGYFGMLEDEGAALEEQLRAAGRSWLWLRDEAHAAEELPAMRVLACGALPDVDWSQAGALRLVQVMGAGVDHLDLSALPAHVAVANARGIHALEMRDHVLAMMLAFERQLPRLIVQQAQQQWSRFAAGSLHRKTLGILGVGSIGGELARACQALGMRVIGTRMSAQPVAAVDRIYPPEATAEVVAEADHLVVCLPRTPLTQGLLDEAMLARLAPHAVLIAVSRGGIIDEAALRSLLERGAIRAAALDVFQTEPLPPGDPLWDTPRLLISPHLAGLTYGYAQRGTGALLSNLARMEAGQALLTAVDRSRGY